MIVYDRVFVLLTSLCITQYFVQKERKKTMRRRPGFTLIELIIVLAMVAIVIALVSPSIIRAIHAHRAKVHPETKSAFSAPSSTMPTGDVSNCLVVTVILVDSHGTHTGEAKLQLSADDVKNLQDKFAANGDLLADDLAKQAAQTITHN